MRRDNELDIGEVAFEPEAESLLPRDVEMQVDFIDEDDTTMEHLTVTFIYLQGSEAIVEEPDDI
jgi:hypothetical protein